MVAGKCRDADRHWHAFGDGRWASRGQFDPAFITTFYHPAVDLSDTNAGPDGCRTNAGTAYHSRLRLVRAGARYRLNGDGNRDGKRGQGGDTLGVDRRIFPTAL